MIDKAYELVLTAYRAGDEEAPYHYSDLLVAIRQEDRENTETALHAIALAALRAGHSSAFADYATLMASIDF